MCHEAAGWGLGDAPAPPCVAGCEGLGKLPRGGALAGALGLAESPGSHSPNSGWHPAARLQSSGVSPQTPAAEQQGLRMQVEFSPGEPHSSSSSAKPRAGAGAAEGAGVPAGARVAAGEGARAGARAAGAGVGAELLMLGGDAELEAPLSGPGAGAVVPPPTSLGAGGNGALVTAGGLGGREREASVGLAGGATATEARQLPFEKGSTQPAPQKRGPAAQAGGSGGRCAVMQGGVGL